MSLQLFLICFGPEGPFLRRLVATDLVVIWCYFVVCWLVLGLLWCFFLRI